MRGLAIFAAGAVVGAAGILVYSFLAIGHERNPQE